MSPVRSRGFIVRHRRAVPGLLLAAWVLGAQAADEPLADCRELRQREPARAIARCAEVAEAALAGGRIDIVEEAWLQQSDAELATGDVAAATRTLERIERLPPAAQPAKRSLKLFRRRGILAYRADHYAQALVEFRAALDLARGSHDAVGEAQAQNDLGNALRRIGDYRAALEAYLASLALKRGQPDAPLGPILNNLADLYVDLGEADTALDRYREAIAAHRRDGRPLDAAHSSESLARLLADRGEPVAARAALEEALQIDREGGVLPAELRVLAQLAALDRAQGDRVAAARWVAQGVALPLPAAQRPADFIAEQAEVELAAGRAAAAVELLRAALPRFGDDAVERIPLDRLLAGALEQSGDAAAALAAWQRYQAEDSRRREREHDAALDRLRVRFEVAERDRAIETLRQRESLQQATLARRNLQMGLLASVALSGVLLLGLLWQRSRQHYRLTLARRDAERAAEAQEFRRAAQALAGDSQRLRALLDASEDALLALAPDGSVVHANAAARRRLGLGEGPLEAASLAQVVGAERGARIAAALAVIDEQPRQVLDVDGAEPLALNATSDGELAVLRWLPTVASDGVIAATPEAAAAAADDTASGDAPERFRHDLVELMLAAVESWEQATRSTRIELAEKSRLWRVTIDDGRLRVRAMERYLTLAKLPRQPRWREVLRTAYFVLAECDLPEARREDLRQRCERINQAIRDRASRLAT
jgi:tetratricopeptide (TPR) repeat protein